MDGQPVLQRTNSNPKTEVSALKATRKYAKFQHSNSNGVARQTCALLCLENQNNKPVLRMYSYNLSQKLHEGIITSVKE